MSNKQETISDIVAEMRCPYYKICRSNVLLDKDMMGYMSFMADRIEEAAKREREAGELAAQICGMIGEFIGREATREKSSQVGNSAEMRERCEEVKDKAKHLWRASLISRRRSSRIQVEVAAQDYDNAVARAKCINPEYVEVEWCRKILSFSNNK